MASFFFWTTTFERERGYLEALLATYRDSPDLAGLGGVDLLSRRAPGWRRSYEYLDPWVTQQRSFQAEFLYGCNMSFRRSALAGLDAPDFFGSYSLGEDLYRSALARLHGPLLVNPRMRVRHYQSPISRDRAEQVFYTQLVNHHHLLVAREAPGHRRVALIFTAAGLLAMFAVKWLLDCATPGRAPDNGRLRGSGRGFCTWGGEQERPVTSWGSGDG